jgi:cation transport ATPase
MRRAASLLALVLGPAAARAEFRFVEFTLAGVDCAQCFESLPGRMKRTRGVESVELDTAKSTVAVKLAAGNRVRIELLADAIRQDGTKIRQIRLEATGAVALEGGRLSFTPAGLAQSYLVEGARAAESATIEGVIREPGPPPWMIQVSRMR